MYFLIYVVSWHQTGHCCCDSSVRHGRNLELCEKERLMFLFLCIYNLNLSLILALVSWQICKVTEEDVRKSTFRLLSRHLAKDELIWHSFADILPEF